MLKEIDEYDPLGPRAPAGFAALHAPSSQVLLPLTVSNKCGQAFRWRGITVWEPLQPPLSHSGIDQKSDLCGYSERKTEDDCDARRSHSLWREQTEWSLCLSDRVILLRQDEERGFIYHKTLLPASGSDVTLEQIDKQTERWLRDYLNLEVPLEALYEEWAEKDKVFARFADRFTGLRMLRQDPWECLCAFICSSNNNIARIGQMVQNLCTHFSPPLLSHPYPACPHRASNDALVKLEETQDVKPTSVTIDYHPFPSPQKLAEDGVEEKLRALGFGYRAKYIATTARMLCEKHRRLHNQKDEKHWDYGIKNEEANGLPGSTPPSPSHSRPVVSATATPEASPKKRRRKIVSDQVQTETEGSDLVEPTSPHSVRSYLESLRRLNYHEARQELLQFPGIGPKVADCILLMSLDQPSSIPVDRHVFQFAERWYSIRTKRYEDIAQRFRDLWGEYAGWAHSVLFTADLRSFATYNAAKKEEAVPEPLEDGSLFAGLGDGSIKTEEQMLQAVHSPPRVAVPDLVPSANGVSPRKRKVRQGREGGAPRVKEEELKNEGSGEDDTVELGTRLQGSTLAERIKTRTARRRTASRN